MSNDEDDTRLYQVVVNDEEQYSVWPGDRTPPAGWRPDGAIGTRADCLAHIDAMWTDLRPRSLREQLATGPHTTGPGAVS